MFPISPKVRRLSPAQILQAAHKLQCSARAIRWLEDTQPNGTQLMRTTSKDFLRYRGMGKGSWDCIARLQAHLGEQFPVARPVFDPTNALHLGLVVPIHIFPFPKRLRDACRKLKVTCLRDALEIPPRLWLQLPNLGQTSLRLLDKQLRAIKSPARLGQSTLSIFPWKNKDRTNVPREHASAIQQHAQTLLRTFITEQGGSYTLEGIIYWLAYLHKPKPNSTPRILLECRFGLKGEGYHTLESAGQLIGVCRERVRQVEERVLRPLPAFLPYLPILQEVLQLTREQLPLREQIWQQTLHQQGYTRLSNFPFAAFQAIMQAAQIEHLPQLEQVRQTPWVNEGASLKGQVKAMFKTLLPKLQGFGKVSNSNPISHKGQSCPREVFLLACGTRAFTVIAHKDSLHVFRPSNLLLSGLRKILCVCPRVHVDTVCAQMLKHPRLRVIPPQEVILQYAQQQGFAVSQNYISAASPLDPQQELSPIEWAIYQRARQQQSPFHVSDVIRLMPQAAPLTIQQYCRHSPFLCHIPWTSYAYLLGREPTAEQLQQVQQASIPLSQRPRFQLHNNSLRVVRQLNRGTVLSFPDIVATHIQGEFHIEDPFRGTLKVKHRSCWKYWPAIKHACNGHTHILFDFHLDTRTVHLTLGDQKLEKCIEARDSAQ